jgi:subtilase family serine protease
VGEEQKSNKRRSKPMKHSIELRMAGLAALLVFACAMFGLAQESVPGAPEGVSESVQSAPPHVLTPPGTLIIPQSSRPQKAPAGHYFAAHTNVEIFIPDGFNPEELPPYSGYGYETPQSLECHYGLTSNGGLYPNCNPNATGLGTATVGSKTIAIVDAYDDPEAPADLAYFSEVFGLPYSPSQFQVVWANTANSSCPGNYGYGVPIDYSGGWELEESLDIEWSHAMAPNANIYLVEACSNYDYDLQQAVLVANNLVLCGNTEIGSNYALGSCPAGSTGKGEVSMSWGGGEYSSETGTSCTASNEELNDACFTTPGVVYFASSGDSPGVIYPGTSPNVVSAGGTSNRRNVANFNFLQEAAWTDGGGGQSFYEKIPSYQSTYLASSKCATWRCVPDLSFDADPYTGVWVYDTFPDLDVYPYEFHMWWIVGGTSVSAPSLAGIVNNAATVHSSFAASSNAELTTIYKNMTTAADFTDITYGFCGPYAGLSTSTGYDFCTGVGVDKGFAGK